MAFTSSLDSVSVVLMSWLTPESFVPLYVSWYRNGLASGKESFHARVTAGWSIVVIGTSLKSSTAGAKSVWGRGEERSEGGGMGWLKD